MNNPADFRQKDGFNFYIDYLVKNDELDNIHFPRVYSVQKIEDKDKKYIHVYKTEKLLDWNKITKEELESVADELFEPDINKNLRWERAEYIHLQISTLIDRAVSTGKTKGLLEGQLLNAIHILIKMLDSAKNMGYRVDLHTENIMYRRTKYGVQLVLNDPIA